MKIQFDNSRKLTAPQVPYCEKGQLTLYIDAGQISLDTLITNAKEAEIIKYYEEESVTETFEGYDFATAVLSGEVIAISMTDPNYDPEPVVDPEYVEAAKILLGEEV